MKVMGERIMAALDYLDAHNAFISQKQKHHRPLGDVDSKYDVDPFDLPLHALLNQRVVLTGTSRTNLSREKTVDEILNEDREKLVRSATNRSSSATPKNFVFSRPQTSLSSGSAVMSGDTRRRLLRAPSQAASTTISRTSTKKITFTPPGINVGPTDARDEVMEEIVNKPLTHTSAKSRSGPAVRSRTATSAPVLGQQGRVSAVGCRSMTSLRRSKTFHGSSRQGEQQTKFETKPGPFATIKVTGPDLWVVSSSTPTSYFNGDLPDNITTNGGSISTKHTSWEDTANSVPREEKKSPPRFQRQLGAPPQFGPTHQWYSFTGGGPTKQRPVLTAFADETEDEYYSIESQVGQKVAEYLEGSPGIRIGVNGQVVAQSMKVNKKQIEKSDSEGGESIEEIEETAKRATEKSTLNGEVDTVCDTIEEDDQKLQNGSANEQKHDENGKKESVCDEEHEDKQFSLLRYLGIARGENPYVVESSSDTTSSTDVASILNFHKEAKNGSVLKFSDQEEALWKILEGASPTLWMDKEKWKRIQIKAKAKEKVPLDDDDGGGPLSWNDQLVQENQKVVQARKKQELNNNDTGMNNRTPVVYHKFIDYDKLPAEFVHLTANGYQPHSSVAAVDKDLDVSTPSKGFQSTIAMRPKTSNSLLTKTPASTNEKFPPRPFTTEPLTKPEREFNEEDVAKSTGVGVSDIMRISAGGDIPGTKKPQLQNSTENSPKPDDVTEEELEAIRMEAAHKMRMTGGAAEESTSIFKHLGSSKPTSKQKNNEDSSPQSAHTRKVSTDKSVTLNSLPVKSDGLLATVDIRPSKPRSSMPVSSLNLSEMEEHYNVVNGPNPTPSQSARPNEQEEIEEIHEKITGILKTKGGHDVPLNTPKSPMIHSTFFKEESLSSSPKHHDPHSPSSAASRMMTDFSTSRLNRPSKSASFASRSSVMSPRSNVHQSISSATRHVQSHASEGFVGSPLSSKPASRNSSKFIGGSIRSSKPNKPGCSVIPHGNTYADLITKSGFIQISHPIHFSLHQKSAAGSGNKMFDSYMRELSSRSGKTPDDAESEAQKSGTLVGKRLGGTSGKLLPEYMRKPRHQGETQLGKGRGGHSGFAGFGGRRSGLAITNEQARLNNSGQPAAEDVGLGGVSLGLQGGQLRLNLDKNIHVIYRDLGIPKKSSKTSSVVVSRQNSRGNVAERPGSCDKREMRSIGQRSSSAKSRPYSAKSEQIRKSVSDFEPNSSVQMDSLIFTPAEVQKQSQSEILKIDIDANPDLKSTTEIFSSKDQSAATCNSHQMQSRNSSAKSKASIKLLNEAVDFGTQWSPHEPLDAIASERHRVTNTPQMTPKETLEVFVSEEQEVVKTEQNVQKASGYSQTPKNGHAVEVENVQDFVEDNIEEATVAESKALEIEPKKSESDVSGEEKQPEEIETSKKLGKEKAEATETEVPDDQEIRGVTKVTVNIAISG